MPYLTLEEAAQYVNRKTGQQIVPENLLRAGIAGILLICAPFGFCVMYNATTKENENFCADLLIIPPAHLLEIETEGEANIQVAFSLDGKTIYFPHRKRTLDQLRVLVNLLDEFIPHLVPMQQALMQKMPGDNQPRPSTPKAGAMGDAIIMALEAEGYAPLRLPNYKNGFPGVKAHIRTKLSIDKGSFDRVWQGLLSKKLISYIPE